MLTRVSLMLAVLAASGWAQGDRRTRSPNVVQPSCAERQKASLAELEKRHTAMMQDIERDLKADQGTWSYKGPLNQGARQQAEKIHERSVQNAQDRAEEARAIETREYTCRKEAIEMMCTATTAEVNRRRAECLQQPLPPRRRSNARVGPEGSGGERRVAIRSRNLVEETGPTDYPALIAAMDRCLWQDQSKLVYYTSPAEGVYRHSRL